MSDFSKGITTTVVILICVLLVGCGVFFYFTPQGITMKNDFQTTLSKTEDNTSYENRKKVEDTCRSLIASYKSDRLTYFQYRDSKSKDERSWGEQAKIRANKTALEYNEYILKNGYVWKENIPKDIYIELETLG